MEIAEFLLARIAEDETVAGDEAVARATAGTVVLGSAYDDQPNRVALQDQIQEAVIDLRRVRPWTSPWDPTRVLTECEAKRRIVEEAWQTSGDNYADWNGGWLDGQHEMATTTLRLLALPYADHPDFREEWRH